MGKGAASAGVVVTKSSQVKSSQVKSSQVNMDGCMAGVPRRRGAARRGAARAHARAERPDTLPVAVPVSKGVNTKVEEHTRRIPVHVPGMREGHATCLGSSVMGDLGMSS